MNTSPNFRLATSALAAIATPLLLTAQTPDARENGEPVATYWASGLTPAAMTAQLSQGWRITDLQIDSTSPWLFTAAMVPNSGSNAIASWWYYGLDGAGVVGALQQNNARLIDVEPYDDGAGNTRFACVMVSNAGANNKGWDWLYDATTASISALVAQNKRIVDLEQYTVGGQTRYACVTVNNTGADQRAWWYYYGVSATTLGTLLTQNNARVYDLDREGGNYNVVMIGATNQPKTWRYFGLTGAQVSDTLSQIGARMFDVNRYTTLSGARYDVAFVNNSNALSTRLSEILRSNTDGVSGVFLKRANGPELAYINGDRPHEPASTLKTLHNLEAMRQVQLGNTTMTSQYTTYLGTSGSCPTGGGASVDETLDTVLSLMMEQSDNNRTRTVVDNFGGFAQLNNRAAALGMTSTQVNHHIGCGTPANLTTLRDISRLHEQVINGYLGPWRETFYRVMDESYEAFGFAEGELGPILAAEAAAVGLSSQQFAAFKHHFRVCSKRGGYGVAGEFFRCWGAYVRMPVQSGGQLTMREYTVGSFVANATVEAGAINAAKFAAAEALREEARAAMQTWVGVVAASTTTVGTGCGSPAPYHSVLDLPRFGSVVRTAVVNEFSNAPALLAIGFSTTSANGVPLPFDLSLIGAAPGCMAFTDLAITQAVLTNGPNTVTTCNLTMPNNVALAGSTFYTQWYSFDGTGQQPFKVSNARRNVLGL